MLAVAAVGLVINVLRVGIAFNREPEPARDESVKALTQVTRHRMLRQDLGFWSAVTAVVAVGSIVMSRLVESVFAAGPFNPGAMEAMIVFGFALCAAGVAVQAKVRQDMAAKFAEV